ncbi:nucleotide sugar dehydrogenase [Listeria booriae]|uniref:Nucleotide sugar dehydrogenase n=1 Tax=Listeria booriae TaxID=1552123 RepID=A0A7X0ZMU0_9LIST|nr:nucleotide sugar dehydrogenase [Listeria booriae]MBC2284256.1 nucleotide sugar dehydrogenase [Listeria booriae]MBC2292380.1 nucleotide sugar dehydrogenase [Listeria booriae]MBC2304420.1 nucleotide sugar dehydrogenase [Listeria booriae]MBC2310776.1 nucleotide sugar dehydrogenase [Listeria booriae]
MQAVETLINKFENKEATIAVMGLGYVGLPLAVLFAEKKMNVIGFELSENKVGLINAGISDIMDIPSERLKQVTANERLVATTDASELYEADAIIICVPTPLTASYEPDISYITHAVEIIRQHMSPNTLIVLESTTYPGTSRELLLAPIAANNYTLGEDFYICYSPERVDPGNKNYQTENTPKVVGGIDEASTKAGLALYETVIQQVVPVASTEVAEMSKLLENTFRSINIAFINEMAMLCDKMGIDIWETIEASSTKPFGFMRFNPGPGIGGHCIPLDPIYLSWKAKEANFFSRFIELAQETNSQMPDYIVHKAATALNTVKKSLNGSTILLIGMAYKENIDDLRESPSIPIFESLQAQGAMVSFCDPLATDFRSKDGATHHTIPLDYAQMAHYDLVITLTCHDLFDKDKVAEHSRLILDTKNAFAHIDSRKIVRFGDATFQIANDATHVSL